MQADNENNIDDLILELFPPAPEEPVSEPAQKPKAITRKTQNLYRRAFSESQLLDILPRDLEEGHSYHVITAGDIDALSYLKHIVRAQPLRYCLFSTWCMADDDVKQFADWVNTGRIARIDGYCGEISANINTNPRTEQGSIHIGHDIYEFYKSYYDGVQSFLPDYPDWQPYREETA